MIYNYFITRHIRNLPGSEEEMQEKTERCRKNNGSFSKKNRLINLIHLHVFHFRQGDYTAHLNRAQQGNRRITIR